MVQKKSVQNSKPIITLHSDFNLFKKLLLFENHIVVKFLVLSYIIFTVALHLRIIFVYVYMIFPCFAFIHIYLCGMNHDTTVIILGVAKLRHFIVNWKIYYRWIIKSCRKGLVTCNYHKTIYVIYASSIKGNIKGMQ